MENSRREKRAQAAATAGGGHLAPLTLREKTELGDLSPEFRYLL